MFDIVPEARCGHPRTAEFPKHTVVLDGAFSLFSDVDDFYGIGLLRLWKQRLKMAHFDADRIAGG